jgi:hypothetical protein
MTTEKVPMIDTLVRELSYGEEMVVEGGRAKVLSDDPRDRTIEARRQAFDPSPFVEGHPW